MPILVEHYRDGDGEGRAGPRVYCDECGKQIEDARWGWYWFRMADPSGTLTPAPQPIYFAHKPDCNNRLQRRLEADGSAYGSEELSRLPLYLENVLHVDRKDSLAWLS